MKKNKTDQKPPADADCYGLTDHQGKVWENVSDRTVHRLIDKKIKPKSAKGTT